jgi:hypothetical protein
MDDLDPDNTNDDFAFAYGLMNALIFLAVLLTIVAVVLSVVLP